MNRREFVVAGSFTLATLAISTAAQEKKQYVCPPCGCSNDGTAHNEPGNCPACDMVLIEKTAAMSELTGIPNFLKLTDQVWTGGQPWLEHLSKLKDAGIKVDDQLAPSRRISRCARGGKSEGVGNELFQHSRRLHRRRMNWTLTISSSSPTNN